MGIEVVHLISHVIRRRFALLLQRLIIPLKLLVHCVEENGIPGSESGGVCQKSRGQTKAAVRTVVTEFDDITGWVYRLMPSDTPRLQLSRPGANAQTQLLLREDQTALQILPLLFLQSLGILGRALAPRPGNRRVLDHHRPHIRMSSMRQAFEIAQTPTPASSGTTSTSLSRSKEEPAADAP